MPELSSMMLKLNGLPMVVVTLVAILVFVFLIHRLRLLSSRLSSSPKSVAMWGRSVEFNSQQLSGMRSLWTWYTSGNKPVADPLKLLSPAEIADLLNKVGLAYKPEVYRQPNEAALREELILELEERGMDSLQAEIVTGMKYGRLGPANNLN